MSVFLAMSCLQGRTQDAAWDDLCALGPDGIQLSPGNLPSPAFSQKVARAQKAARSTTQTSLQVSLHHGYVDDALRTPVWSTSGALLVSANRSVHPPMTRDGVSDAWWAAALDNDVVVEVMYPGYEFCGDRDVEHALDLGLRLAVDVSHLWLQRCAGVLSTAVERRLLESDRVVEVHVSENDGVKDSHTSLTPGCFALGWARERGRAGLPVVLESYFHKTSDSERRRQLDLLR